MTFVGKEGFDANTQATQSFLRQRNYKMIREVVEETNKKLGKSLAEGISKGESIPQIRKRVTDLFENMARYRGDRIARTEVMNASNYATEEAYKQSGVVQEEEWLTALDERTCPWCSEMNGKTVNLGDRFFSKGDSLDVGGKLLNFNYESIERPPLHANCRCTLLPVIK